VYVLHEGGPNGPKYVVITPIYQYYKTLNCDPRIFSVYLLEQTLQREVWKRWHHSF